MRRALTAAAAFLLASGTLHAREWFKDGRIENVCASFAHISHGAALGIETEKANSGLNFLYLEYRYR
jgi:hypothetical protein